jgi:hypothetical protein
MVWSEWTFIGFVLSGISISYALVILSLNVERIADGFRNRPSSRPSPSQP